MSNYEKIISGVKKEQVLIHQILLKRDCLASSKYKVGKLGIDELETVPIGLSKLSNTINNDTVKKTIYDELVKEHYST